MFPSRIEKLVCTGMQGRGKDVSVEVSLVQRESTKRLVSRYYTARVSTMKVADFNLQLISVHHATASIDFRDELGRGIMDTTLNGIVMQERRAKCCDDRRTLFCFLSGTSTT
jgi:hypothetical protein